MTTSRQRRIALTALVLLGSPVLGQDPVPDLAADEGGPAVPLFTEVSSASGIDFVHTFGDSDMSNLVESTGVGVCLLDYDGDRLLDIYFVNGANLPEVSEGVSDPAGDEPRNRLYRNLGGWRFEDVTAEAGVGDPGYGMGCVAGDLDNDGDPDLIVTNYGPNRAYRNDGADQAGKVKFTDITEQSGLGDPSWSLGAVLLDFDGDGLLDLYVGNYVQFDKEYRTFYISNRFPGPLAYPGSPDRLYRNLGHWRFEDITERAGVGNPEGRAMGVGAADYDNDRDQDIFVSNDAMANYLYRNLGDGRFEEVALVAGVAFGESGDATAAMGVDFADFDGDGLLDLVVPDMTFNALYRALPGELFQDLSRASGLASASAQFVGWSGHFLDADNNGWVDLFITTGDLHDLEPQEDLLLRNETASRFRDVSLEAGGYFRRETMGRGAAVGDLDNDGDQDIVLNLLAGAPVLLRNDSHHTNHWLTLRTVGRSSNRDGIGTRITAETSSGLQMREVRAGSGYLSCSDPRAHFGLGNEIQVRRITVSWPSGQTQILENVPVDQFRVVEEPE
jgi:hypothetical protein